MEGAEAGVARLFLIGYPVGHSLSPAIYRGVFREYGLNAIYEPLEVPSRSQLRRVLKGLRLSSRGFNVTIPYKSDVTTLLDRLEDPASTVGAVNTVVNENGALIGYNTDWLGFKLALEMNSPKRRFAKALLIGAGGAARAVAYALRESVDKLVIVSRGGLSAESLASRALEWGIPEAEGHKASPEVYRRVVKDVELVINASPVGTLDPTVSPIPVELLPSGIVVFDLVYRPLRTQLLRAAEDKNCITIDGLWMLASQASLNLRLWFSIDVDVAKLRSYALGALEAEEP